ncbi:F-box protein At5g03100 [Linum grandiflorum]
MENTSMADGISELPDEILHCILSRIEPQRKAAQTITLSRRWRSLWRSYPVVDFSFQDVLQPKSFQKFCEATIARFSRDSSLGMKTLKLHLMEHEVKLCLPVFKQLLDLSSERKAEEIDFWCSTSPDMSITFELLSNSATKIMKTKGVQFAYNNDLALSLNSLRFLHLDFVSFEDDRILGNVLACSPLLETVEIDFFNTITELKVFTRHTNLKTLRIASCAFRQIEIAFPGLQTLRLERLCDLSKFELTAPQLNLLQITDCENCCFDTVISKLQYLKTLKLKDAKHGKKLKLSNPKLEELMLWGSGGGLEEIEITVPGLQTLRLEYLRDLSKFELTAPQLNFLAIRDCRECCFDAVISKLRHLKTLTLDRANHGKILKLSNPKLEECTLSGSGRLEEIEIAVPVLQTLRFESLRDLSKLKLTAPQLNHLKITDCRDCCFDAVISKLQHLKTLTLDGANHRKKLKLLNPKLKEFTLRGCGGLEKIEINAGPSLVKFLLKLRDANYSFDEIKKFQISNVRLDNVDFSLEIHTPENTTHHWFVALKNLLVRLTQFSTLNIITNDYFYLEVEFEVDDDHSMPPVEIKHLTIQIGIFSRSHYSKFLGRLFWALRPRYLTIIQVCCDDTYEMLVLNFLNLMKTDRHGELFQNWRGQLKDIKIVTRVEDRATRKGVTTVSFMLTWH